MLVRVTTKSVVGGRNGWKVGDSPSLTAPFPSLGHGRLPMRGSPKGPLKVGNFAYTAP